MTADRITEITNKLNLPLGEYVIFGGSTLSLSGIRDSKDIDFFVTDKLAKQLALNGWKEVLGEKPHLVKFIDGYEIQAFNVWNTGAWQPKIEEYIKNPEIIKGLPCMPLEGLYEWKAATRRTKDLKDMELIKEYWDRSKN